MTDTSQDPRAKRREWERQYYQRNRERLREYNTRWQRENPDRNNAKTKKYAASPKGQAVIRRMRQSAKHQATRKAYAAKARANNLKWYYSDLQRSRLIKVVNESRRRARKAQAPGDATREQVFARIAVWGFKCWMCRAPYEAVDHVIPLSKGGSNWPANLRPICNPCNATKGAKVIHLS